MAISLTIDNIEWSIYHIRSSDIYFMAADSPASIGDYEKLVRDFPLLEFNNKVDKSGKPLLYLTFYDIATYAVFDLIKTRDWS
jgi:hypothetical protein